MDDSAREFKSTESMTSKAEWGAVEQRMPAPSKPGGGECLRPASIQCPSDLFNAVGLEHVVLLDVVESLQSDAALHAAGYLFDVLLDSLE